MNMFKNLTLVGNPNVGKTTIFNKLTKSFEHTGNWHGVTVDVKQKSSYLFNNKADVIDLPGIYSLTSFSFEEQVAIDYLLKNKDELTIINVCDANVLQRNLYLTLQLLEMGLKPCLYINFAREVKKRETIINYDSLQEKLGLPIFCDGKNLNKLKSKIDSLKNNTNIKLNYFEKLPLQEILNILNNEQKYFCNLPQNFIAIKILEEDEKIVSALKLNSCQDEKIKRILNEKDYKQEISKLRYEFIENILANCIVKKQENIYGKFKIDKIILNKFLSFPIFFAILFLIFYVTFSSIGAQLSSFLKLILDKYVGLPIKNFLINVNSPSWMIGLFSVGIMESVGGLFSFIPQIVLLFLFLSILEDSGYMSRLAFCFEDILYSIGLSGKSVFTILMSFGCSTSAILTARNIEDRNTKIKTAIISPYMSCSAKLPIFAVIGGAFFSKGNIFVIIGLYLLSIVIGILVSLFLDKFVLKSGERSFILEFPPYRFPSIKRVAKLIFENCKQFIVKVGTILLSFSVIVWILQNFSFDFQYVPTSLNSKSILQVIGETLSFLFSPIGLGSWGIVVSLIVGIMAKEMVVSTMAIVNKIPSSTNFDEQLGLSLISGSYAISFSPITAVIMMVFSLLYMPCISTIAMLKKEIGLKYTLLACLIQFSISYLICFVIYNIYLGSLFIKIILIALSICFICVSVYFSIFKKKKCQGCSQFSNCSTKGFKC